jgi:hypothetical protein
VQLLQLVGVPHYVDCGDLFVLNFECGRLKFAIGLKGDETGNPDESDTNKFRAILPVSTNAGTRLDLVVQVELAELAVRQVQLVDTIDRLPDFRLFVAAYPARGRGRRRGAGEAGGRQRRPFPTALTTGGTKHVLYRRCDWPDRKSCSTAARQIPML